LKLKTLIFGPILFCLLWFLGWEAYAIWDARQKTSAVFEALARDGRVQVAWDDLSAEQQDILLKVEDPKFMTHKGVDLQTPGAGPSTITEALAKALYFETITPGFFEIEHRLIAFFVIDPKVSKQTQLDAFLNLAAFGRHNGRAITGFDEAARVFFAKPLRNLTRFEFVQLVAMLAGPDRYKKVPFVFRI